MPLLHALGYVSTVGHSLNFSRNEPVRTRVVALLPWYVAGENNSMVGMAVGVVGQTGLSGGVLGWVLFWRSWLEGRYERVWLGFGAIWWASQEQWRIGLDESSVLSCAVEASVGWVCVGDYAVGWDSRWVDALASGVEHDLVGAGCPGVYGVERHISPRCIYMYRGSLTFTGVL